MFRVSIGYYRCPKYWEATAEYTWFHDEGKDHAGPFVRPTRDTPPPATLPFQSASISADLDYQVGDLYVARVFDPNPHLRLRLLAGITGSYFNQNVKITYTDAIDRTQNLKEKWKFWGVGLRAGLRADWYWGCQFYITGKVSFATLFGEYKNKEEEFRGEGGTLADASYKDTRFTYHVQFILGPSWQLPCDCWSAELFAGYESNIWFNIHERYRAFPTAPAAPTEIFFASGLFGVHGLTVRLTVGF